MLQEKDRLESLTQRFHVPHLRQQPRRLLPFPKQVYRHGHLPLYVITLQKPVPAVNPIDAFDRMYPFAFRQGPGQPKIGIEATTLKHEGRNVSRVSSAAITFRDSEVSVRSIPSRAVSVPSKLKPAVLSSVLVTAEVSKNIKQRRNANRGAICCWIECSALVALMMLKNEVVGRSE